MAMGERVRTRDMRPLDVPSGSPYRSIDAFFSQIYHPKPEPLNAPAPPPPADWSRIDIRRHGYKPAEGETTDPPKHVPPVFAHYRILRHLGRGSFARVDLAVDLHGNNTAVALKFTGRTYGGVEIWYDREFSLQRAAAKDNPFVIPIREMLESPKYLVAVMDQMDAGSLNDRIQLGTLSENESRPIIQRLVLAAILMHRAGVGHKDIKPHNMMFSTRYHYNHPFLTDFGLAVYLDERDAEWFRHLPWGTSWYMGPEQWFTLYYGRVDVRKSDVTSIGCTLHHMLFGHPPDRGAAEEIMLEWDLMRTISPEASDFIQRTAWPYPDYRVSTEELYWHPWVNPTYTLEEYVMMVGYPKAPPQRWNPGWIV
jgi:serine/threonine protein kinase